MKLIIDIDKADYELCKDPMQPMPFHSIKRAIANGKPLPKGHGRLIDADETLKAMNTWVNFGYLPHDLIRLVSENGLKLVPYVHYDDMVKCVTNMPSIIEADKGESEDKE